MQQTIDKIKLIRERLLTSQTHQISYVDLKRRKVEFKVGDHIFLKVSPMKGVKRFRVRGKLNLRFVGQFGKLAYRFALPPALAVIHNVFHMSMLRKYVPNPNKFDSI